MKPIYFLFTFLSTTISFSQNSLSDKFNKITPEELSMTVYEKDTTAHAVVLEEYGENYFDVINDRIHLVKHFYAKIKILDKQGIEEANIEIPVYKNEDSSEYIKNIKAATHNSDKIDYLEQDQIFSIDITNYYAEKRFTFPNVKAGSIIEYQYTLESPFYYNLEGWDFQSHIPKIYSEFNAKIPANYRYNRILKGSQTLDIEEASVEKRCFKIQGFIDKADCEVLKYAMKDIPAFKEESYMLSRNNYLSKIAFELSEFIRFDGGKDVYTKTWQAVDKDMRKDRDIGMQVRKNSFFKNQLSDAILNETSDLEKAKNIYTFIQDHYTWNGKYGLFGDASVRRAFQEKLGNVAEINLSLINSLLAADIETETIMLSTRAKGLPTQKHPVMSDFNYLIAKVTIGEETFLLDATDKFLSFGLLPIRALNYNGRAMDFKNPSYWFTINPYAENRQNTVISISVTEDGSALGKISQVSTGYLAYDKRKELAEQSTESYLDALENQLSFISVEEYDVEERTNLEKPIKETFSITFDEDGFSSTETFLDPFFIKVFSKNPFKLEERQYPVDFAYSRIYTTRFLLSLPPNYEFSSIPEDQTFIIDGNKAVCELKVVQQNGQLNMSFKLIINNFYFTPEEYQDLKTFFTKLSILQKNTRIAIKKKNS